MTPGQQIKARRKELGLYQKDLATAVGVSNVTISQWENDETTPATKHATKLCQILEIPFTSYMDIYEMEGAFSGDQEFDVGYETHTNKRHPAETPLLTSVQAGAWEDEVDPYEPGVADEWLLCPSKGSESTYALRVEGDSMTAQFGKSYPEGSIIFVDPALLDVTTGDRIIAKIKGDSKTTFKVYVEDAGKKYLKPLNPAYPLITDPFRVLGKVIGKWEYE